MLFFNKEHDMKYFCVNQFYCANSKRAICRRLPNTIALHKTAPLMWEQRWNLVRYLWTIRGYICRQWNRLAHQECYVSSMARSPGLGFCGHRDEYGTIPILLQILFLNEYFSLNRSLGCPQPSEHTHPNCC